MSGPRIEGWPNYETAIANFEGVQESVVAGKFDQGQAIVSIDIGLQNLAAGIEQSLQELYERLQRLHQKIDRMEAKIGSVPKK